MEGGVNKVGVQDRYVGEVREGQTVKKGKGGRDGARFGSCERVLVDVTINGGMDLLIIGTRMRKGVGRRCGVRLTGNILRLD